METTVGAGVGAAIVDQSMGGKVGSRQRRVETEQYKADKWAAGERVSRVTQRASRFNQSLVDGGRDVVQPDRKTGELRIGREGGGLSGMATAAAKTRITESKARVVARFNQQEDGTTRTHRVQGSLLTAAASAGAVGRGIRKIPKVAKYGALGLAATGLGAPAAVIGAGLYGASKLRKYRRDAPIRQENNLAGFRQHQETKAAQVKESAVAEETAAAKSKEESQQAEQRTVEERQQAAQRTAEEQARVQAEREQVERDRVAREQRVREWKSGNIGPPRTAPTSGGSPRTPRVSPPPGDPQRSSRLSPSSEAPRGPRRSGPSPDDPQRPSRLDSSPDGPQGPSPEGPQGPPRDGPTGRTR